MENFYDYTITKNYNKEIFAKTVELLMKNLKNIEESEYDEDMYDESQFQYIKTSNGEIKIGNSVMNDAVWVQSEVDIEDILTEWEDKTFYESDNRKLTFEEGSKILQKAEEAAKRFREYLNQKKNCI
ncbi:MAG: hypothetical protein E7410_06910 [Ruminococcaceae bacterium]|nr:hypothetical protein [Oscillospiraceae bacterium]